MEQTATGPKVPFYPSKLQELLTSDRTHRRADYSDSLNVASASGHSFASDEQSEKGKNMTKWKSDASNGSNTGDTNQVSISDQTQPVHDHEADPNTIDSGAIKNPVYRVKEDYEYMGAQIDKLLSMPSPKTSWNKAARRQRKFQCPQCPKSYSTEDDLKSHLQIHAEKTPKHQKPYACSHCDKRFSWKGSLKVHVTKHHAGKPVVGGDDDEDAAESSQDERSSSQEASPDTAIKTKNDATKKLDTPKNPATGSQEPPPKSFESVVNNLLSSGLVSNSSQSPAEKSTLPRRKRSSADAKEMPSTRSTSKKDSKLTKAIKLRGKNDSKKKSPAAAVEEAEESVPPSPHTPSSGRTALRRNIQRPKWLADSDLVTDYEFPRGTNTTRMGNGSNNPASSPSAPQPTTPTTNGNKSRTTSTESVETASTSTPKSQKDDKPKLEPSSRKRKEEVDKSEPKKNENAKRADRKESKRDKDKPTKPVRTYNKFKNRDKAAEKDSPTKVLSTKILSLSLADTGSDVSPGKLAPGKSVSKRNRSESPSSSNSPSKVQPNRRSKRKKSEAEESKQSNGIESDESTPPLELLATSLKIEEKPTLIENPTGSMETTVSASSDKILSSNVEQESKETDSENNNELEEKDTTDAKKLQEGAFLVETDVVTQRVPNTEVAPFQPSQIETEISSLVETNIPTTTGTNEAATAEDVSSTDPNTSTNHVENIQTETKLILEEEESKTGFTEEVPAVSTVKVDTPKVAIATETTSITSEPLFQCEVPSFADIANSSALQIPALDTEVATSIAKPTESRQVETNAPVVVGITEVFDLPITGNNDEEMPVLRPETSSSAAASRSDSFAERFASVDEDMEGNSNHSTLPSAPILSKEEIAAASFVNGFLQIPPKTSKASSIGSTVPEPDHENELMPLVEGDDEGEHADALRLRRDRSDSLSVRSCGSGSPSEKIKALEDSAVKEARTMPGNDFLVDSDSNDSLMSEFSELAAQLSQKTDGIKFKEECLRFITTKVSSNSMWLIRKELKRLKKDKNYFKFGKLSPLAAGLMHDIFCQSLDDSE